MTDTRHVAAGWLIPTDSYSDQPYIVQTDDGGWLCCITTGPGEEGARGQHVATMRSTDQGRTWSRPVGIEPSDSSENSYAVMLKASGGRVFIFYNHNTDNVREVLCHDGKTSFTRVDSLGHYVFKYSDDHGRSWSPRRYDIPVREFACDRQNVYGGTLRFFWNVGRPFIFKGAAYISLHKVGQMGVGFFQQSEGVLLASDNLLTAGDPAMARWQTLPDGDVGLRAPAGGGLVSEEQSYCVLSDGTIHCIYRSTDGYPVCAYSRDGGHTWSPPRYASYPDGRRMKHPRAANFAWRCGNGKYLYWFHNHGGHFIRDGAGGGWIPYEDRNPAWLCGGVEIDTPAGKEIAWSQPEIVLYDDDPFVRMSYPDLVEAGGAYYLTETNKQAARVHEIDPSLLAGLWGQFDAAPTVARDGLLLEWTAPARAGAEQTLDMPALPAFLARDGHRADYGRKDMRQGFTLELNLRPESLAAGQILLDSRNGEGAGVCLRTIDGGAVEIAIADGKTENLWACEPGLLTTGREHRLTVIVDGGPKIISFVIDGRFCDGGEHRNFGWGRFSPDLYHANGAGALRLCPAVRSLRIYALAIRVSQAIANHRGGPGETAG